MVAVRMPPQLITEADAWAEANGMGRSEAIRRLVELGLSLKAKTKEPSAAGANRAEELATKAVEKMIDSSVPSEERAQRRRQLTKGPSEFREDRVDQPKAK